MKILVTGGAGYLGTELTKQLSENPAIEEVIVYDNLSRNNFNLFIGSQKLNPKKVRFVKGELLDSRTLKKELEKADLVYHLAALVTTPFADQNSHLFEQVNHWGTAELVYALEDLPPKPLVYASSCSVYGSGAELVTTETAPNPRTFYGISKMRGEEHVSRLAEKQPVYIFRCGNVYGYNRSMRFDAVINKFMFEANFHGKIRVNGNGHQTRPFIHIEKATKALLNYMSLPAPGTYNLVEKNLSVMEIAETLKMLYPELEMLFVNHHLKLRELKVETSPEIAALLGKATPLQQELETFKTYFAF